MDIKSLEKLKDEQQEPEIKMTDNETTVEEFVSGRVKEMQEFRKQLKIEDDWKKADIEFTPSDLDSAEKREHFEADQETGLRSRLVPIADMDEEWRSRNSDPILASKIQTALSIIIDQNPEAKLTAYGKKFEERTALAYAAWKRNWGISNAKEIYKLFVLNLAKYGWAAGRSFPRIIKYEKDIYTEKGDTPDNNKYNKVTNTWFNDVAKENLNIFRTWIDEQTKPYDDYTMNDCYYEKDYSFDSAKTEFGHYENFDKLVKINANLKMDYDKESTAEKDDDQKTRRDIVTIGFYENRLKDLYCIRIPKIKACLHYCPLPNDDGMLSMWQTMWMLRSSESPYGLSIWQMIKQNKALYDKMQNMTMDQIVLSIYKAFFYTGTSSLIGDGKIKLKPGVGYQIVNGKIDWNEVPGPGKDAYAGLDYLRRRMDDDSAIVPILEGDPNEGKTLGQSLHAKEAALKKMKLPVDNIADAIEQDAYITLSWMSQIYSTPEIMEFAELQDIMDYDMENGTKHDKIYGAVNPETNQPEGPFKATYYPELALGLEKQGGKLVEAKKDRFFQVGSDIRPEQLKWRGMFKVVPKSIVAPSAELEKQRKMEVFNIVIPILPQPPEIFAKPVQQLLRTNEEDPLDWLPDNWIAYLEQDKNALFIKANPNPMMGQPGQLPGMGQGVPSNQTSMQGAAQTTPGTSAPTVVPQSQISTPTLPGVNAAPRTELSRSV